MQNPFNQEKRYYTLADTPWYFGAYLNLARHNLAIVLNDLSIKLGSDGVVDDAGLKSTKAVVILKDTNAKPDDIQKAMEYYEKKLPFLFAMHYRFKEKDLDETDSITNELPENNLSASPEGYGAILHQLIEILNKARNHYSHYNPGTEFSIPADFFYLLNDAFDVNVRLVKSRFGLDEADIHHLRKFIPNKDRDIKDRNGRPCKVIPNPAFKYWFNKKDNKTIFSEYGLAFFICLFLRPGDAYQFLKKISGFKLDNTPSKKATLDAYCVNNLQLPIERLESDNSVQALFLDMCNEIARAPSALYETLHPGKQKLFITKQVDIEEGPELSDDKEVGLETKMIRKSNRFTFLAQRFLDVTNSFKSLRFAVDLGNYHYSIYPKIIAGVEEIRHLTRHLIGYGKLEDFPVDKRPEAYIEKFCSIEQKNQALPLQYIPETYPHYHVENNQIPICLEEGNAYWPGLKTESTGGQKSYPYKYVKSIEKRPYAYLSTYELPALLFYELIQDKISAQDIIVKHIRTVRTFFSDVRNGKVQPVSNILMNKPAVAEINERKNSAYNQRFATLIKLLNQYNLKPQYIPEKLLKYLLGVAQKEANNTNEKAIRRLNAMIEEAENRIERMELREKSDIKPGKKAFKKVKVGKLADILAEDMMLMQPPVKGNDGKCIPSSKANTTAYRVLQSSLAFFGANKDKLPGIFMACKLVGGNNPHPFLNRISVSDQLGIIEFYKAYFAEKAQYLNYCQKAKKYAEYHFLKMKNIDYEIMQLIDEYLNTRPETGHSAFNLPRGLFHQATLDYLKEHGSPVMRQYIESYAAKSNTVHLINYYFEHEHKDASPDFYNWQRQYELFKTPFIKNGDNDYYTIAERQQRFLQIKPNVKEDEKRLPQWQFGAEKDKEDIRNEIRRCRGINEMTDFLIQRYQHKYPLIADLKNVRFRDYEIPRKVISKACGIIDDHLSNIEKRSKAYHFFIENEQYLRLTDVQDKLIFLCIKKMLANSDNKLQLLNGEETALQDNNTFLLKNIAAPNDPEGNKSILNCKPANGISFTHHFYAVNEKGMFEKNEGKLVQMGNVEIIDKHLKIKNNGNFRKLMKDRRLNNLCYYFIPNGEGKIFLDRNVLENEFKEYEKQRLLVLESIANFEKCLYEKHKDQAHDLFYREVGVQKHEHYLSFYQATYESGNEKTLANLSAIRNGFLHNQYPDIKGEQFRILPETWRNRNDEFAPAVSGSTKGYGLINKIAAFAITHYTLMIAHVNTTAYATTI
jgi:hypothetical protein